MKKFVIKKEDIHKVAKELISIADKSRYQGAKIIALSGDLGAGKTTLTQEVARDLGVKENLTSPTFVIMKIYKITQKSFKRLIHIDAYRLNSDAELLNLGFQEMADNNENIIIIEWPERVPECTKNSICKVYLSHVDSETRSLDIVV
ncbi:MAG: tRNA (adenosine(37)-N6)-threonylcarbamoyltransferase complex ATPase subunit type 1 TsaE [bacterium]